ncbi:hypothetical protein, conserved [Eimeria tenella]|uniref:Uncharacterized protein n=1 Tax=Eimeria tenella TaxID=5802 RepID=U6KLP4_EIMTE|nr:hypothetical protein, conserved [Eimeria tenella]CDJ37751.1 hypothetical protein, conserved [Eimeria tenella]|eukprot:XP_013228589.1 hypothetical protein, conserved [Eimeria tenella]
MSSSSSSWATPTLRTAAAAAAAAALLSAPIGGLCFRVSPNLLAAEGQLEGAPLGPPAAAFAAAGPLPEGPESFSELSAAADEAAAAAAAAEDAAEDADAALYDGFDDSLSSSSSSSSAAAAAAAEDPSMLEFARARDWWNRRKQARQQKALDRKERRLQKKIQRRQRRSKSDSDSESPFEVPIYAAEDQLPLTEEEESLWKDESAMK